MSLSRHICILLAGLATCLQATVINIPADHTTIQAGIDAAMDGDTVLVQPGHYVENINFIGKNIVVGSLMLTTSDTSYISQTIIDGDSSGSVVTFENGESSSALLYGFTITNGATTSGGGIYCSDALPSLQHLVICDNTAERGGGIHCGGAAWYYEDGPFLENLQIHSNNARLGGGIYIYDSNPQLHQISIANNYASQWGGGIYTCNRSYPQMNNLLVSKNRAGMGGGIYFDNLYYTVMNNTVIDQNTATWEGGGLYLEDHALDLTGVTITNNISGTNGGGIWTHSSTLNLQDVKITHNFAHDTGGGIFFLGGYTFFNASNRSSIFMNNAVIGKDLACEHLLFPINVLVDTFTVLNPTDVYAHPVDQFSFDILSHKLTPIESDVFVDPSGANSNSGMTANAPLQTIERALALVAADSMNPRTVHLAEGTYSPSTNGDRFPLVLGDHIALVGAGQNRTVLDAEGTGSVIRLNQTHGSAIGYLTATGSHDPSWSVSSGINCTNSTVEIDHVTIRNNQGRYFGGGLYTKNSSLEISYSVICYNTAVYGAGIGAVLSSITFDNVDIFSNSATGNGGGIKTADSEIILNKVSLRHNTAPKLGGGIYREGCLGHITFDEINLSSIYQNQAREGADLYWDTRWCESPMTIVLDTFTVAYPSRYHALPLDRFIFNISNYQFPQYATDLFVSPSGNDANDGLSSSNPLRTITQALITIATDRLNPRTIFLAEGTYSPDSTGERFPLLLGDYLSLVGDSVANVVIDAQGTGSGMRLYSTKEATVTKLTITGGFASYGGGIYSTNSDFLLDQVLITQNSANRDGGAVALVNSNLELEHATLTNNSVPDLYSESSHVKISNTIIWPARWLGIKLVYNKDTEGDSVVIRHSAIRGGLGWIAKDDRVNLTWADSNLDASPLFCHWDEGNYWLSAGSPCLGAGADGTNIGVFGIGCDIPIAIQPSPDATIVSFELHQNYPNPFNPSTTIRYELPEGAMVRLMVYDLQGREITQLVEGNQQIGYHEAVWDGCGRYGRQLPSGIYIARLVTPEYNKSIKMVLLK